MSPLPEPVEVDLNTRQVDHSAIRTTQALMIFLLILAFVCNAWWLVGFVALGLIVGAVVPAADIFKAIYFSALKPAGTVKPDVKRDNPEPRLFAQGFGGTATLIGTLALLGGATSLGWAITWLVAALAAMNLFTGMCVGVQFYYWMNRKGVPGFTHAPLQP